MQQNLSFFFSLILNKNENSVIIHVTTTLMLEKVHKGIVKQIHMN